MSAYYVLGTVKASDDTEVSKIKKASALMELPRQTNVTNTDNCLLYTSDAADDRYKV